MRQGKAYHDGPVSCGAKQVGTAVKMEPGPSPWLISTTEDSMYLFCGANYRADMSITHHGGQPGGVKAASGLTI